MTARVLLVILYLLLVSALPALAGDRVMTCAACGKAITEGMSVQVEGQFYHSSHFVCAFCNRSIAAKSYYKKDGKFYDSVCYVDNLTPTCTWCGMPVGADYVTVEDRPYHQTCYRRHLALFCSLCGEIIEGPYLKDEWGNAYHERHRNEPRCLYCGRILTAATNGGETYSDGRTICGLCLPGAVKELNDANQLLREVKERLAGMGIEIDRDKLPIKLVGRDRMAKVAIRPHEDLEMQGFTNFEKTSYLYGLINQRSFDIYILYGLPRLQYEGTIAHELMHVWLGLNAPMGQNSAMVEGTCNFAAYLILSQMHTPDADHLVEQMMQSSDPDYGEGFRQVLAQVEQRGLESWLEYLKANIASAW